MATMLQLFLPNCFLNNGCHALKLTKVRPSAAVEAGGASKHVTWEDCESLTAQAGLEGYDESELERINIAVKKINQAANAMKAAYIFAETNLAVTVAKKAFDLAKKAASSLIALQGLRSPEKVRGCAGLLVQEAVKVWGKATMFEAEQKNSNFFGRPISATQIQKKTNIARLKVTAAEADVEVIIRNMEDSNAYGDLWKKLNTYRGSLSGDSEDSEAYKWDRSHGMTTLHDYSDRAGALVEYEAWKAVNAKYHAANAKKSEADAKLEELTSWLPRFLR